MYLRILFFSVIIASVFSCENDAKINEIVEVNEIEAELPPSDDFDYDTLKGMYLGDFAGSDIRLILNYVSQSNALGYNIHKGLQRNVTGRVNRSGDSVFIVLSEPGDNEFDGVFNLLFIGNDHNPTGTWESNSGKLSKKKLNLEKLVPPTKQSDKISVGNFADYFDYVSDTIGNYKFESDGLCLFEYYPTTDSENRIEQLVEIQGTWSLNGNTVTIDWQKNDYFPDQKVIFYIKDDDDAGIKVLTNKIVTLYPMYY